MKLLIWGTGSAARMVLSNGIKGEIIGFVRTNPGKTIFCDKPVYTPDQINVEYDAIYVASTYTDDIYDVIMKYKIPVDKVCFMQLPLIPAVDAEKNFKLAQQFLSESNLAAVETVSDKEDSAGFIQQDLKIYNELNTRNSFQYIEAKKYFVWNDKYAQAGTAGHYFFQDLWGAQLIYHHNPAKHYDIGSRLDGFIAHLLTFRDSVTMIDIRPLPNPIPGIEFIQADATNLSNIEDESLESLSALCSLEHFGLGRYGDPIDPEACFKAFQAIQKKVMAGGFVYISVPVGKEHLEFNAHRIFYAKTIVESFDQMELVEYSATDGKGIECNIPLDKYDDYYDGAGIYGLFCLQKRLT